MPAASSWQQNQFGFAVVVVSAGMEGDTQKDLVLTEARAMVVREYLVENFGFDDSQLKTLGMGKQTGANLDADWGSIQILIFPAGTEIPVEKPAPAAWPIRGGCRRPGSDYFHGKSKAIGLAAASSEAAT
jgi:hypothetical protein